jgi:hypothetical protein
MAGYLIAVHYTDSNTSQARTVLCGVQDGLYPNQATAIAQTQATVVAYRTAKGENPINIATLVSQTR